MKLIIVESPTKAKTLSRFLNGKYQVEATMGHIRDLPKADFGVDIDNNFTPRYIIPRDKAKRVGELKEIAAKAEDVILATDPDREGEAIAWHIATILGEKGKGKKKAFLATHPALPLQRIVFHEITKQAIQEALDNPRTIDTQLVDAQQARRILDRLVGYKLSPLLWKKLSKRWLSAGRVQSVTVRLIVEREKEIIAFQSRQFWTIDAVFLTSQKDAKTITAHLVSKDGVKYEETLTFTLFDGKYTTSTTTIITHDAADAIVHDCKSPYTVSAVDKKEVKRSPGAPFTTSTLQQEAGRRFSFSSKKTMQIAQKLYEEGYITYHRTDSVNLSEKFLAESRDYIKNQYGKEYVSDAVRKFQTKSKVAQEAHEAIRPTECTLTADKMSSEQDLNRDHHRIYDIIWKRAIASQAKEAVFDSTTIDIASTNGYVFEAQGSVIKFDGFLKIIGRDTEETVIPDVSVGQTVDLQSCIPQEHLTSPPPRYTEASLVKTLEEKDIGRPSTYAPIISTIQERQYVTREDKKLVPTELGNSVTAFLVEYFANIMELPFTAKLEQDLDSIANGTRKWQPVISEFYEPFAKDLQNSYDKAEKVKVAVEETDEKCPTCGNPLVIRMGRYGKFVACSTFPECKFTRQFQQKLLDVKCPRCGGDIIIKKSRKGKTFYGCSNYPTCNFAAWKKEDIK